MQAAGAPEQVQDPEPPERARLAELGRVPAQEPAQDQEQRVGQVALEERLAEAQVEPASGRHAT